MFIVKLGFVTCAIYMGITLFLGLGLLLLVHFKGSAWYLLNWRSFALLFGFVWLISFSAAWRVVYTQANVH